MREALFIILLWNFVPQFHTKHVGQNVIVKTILKFYKSVRSNEIVEAIPKVYTK